MTASTPEAPYTPTLAVVVAKIRLMTDMGLALDASTIASLDAAMAAHDAEVKAAGKREGWDVAFANIKAMNGVDYSTGISNPYSKEHPND